MKTRVIILCAALLWTGLAALADTLQGVVTNATTGKPAGGTEVTLISLDNGMNEAAHTTTDAGGHFSFEFPPSGMPHLVRATHQSVTYFKMALPGTSAVDLQVYNAEPKLDGISTTVQIMRMQTNGSRLQVMELYAVQNQSQPPRTLAARSTFEISLPEGADIAQSSARAPQRPAN